MDKEGIRSYTVNERSKPYVSNTDPSFDANQRTDINSTVPAHIREVLIERYEYVVAEKEMVPDLTDDLRNCATCEKWCPP